MFSYGDKLRVVSSFADNILKTDSMVDLFNKKIVEEMEILRRCPNMV